MLLFCFYLNLNVKKGYNMNKNFINLLKLTLLVKLFLACGLSGEMKEKLESSVQDIQDEIDSITKEAAAKGVKLEAHSDTATGSRVSENPFIHEAKIRATEVAKKFVEDIEEEATKIKDSGGSGQFSAMYDLMLKAAASLEKIGVQHMTKTVSMGTEQNPANTAERVLEIAKKMKDKLDNVHKKNKTALENLEKKASENGGDSASSS
ncbi:decorin-binding protein DbpA (plasmid) [Borreliella sinica]|uniref:decorin-binding protein DbpA n=1 Tax=Borreliella sinica TaxID=87162 RepID=UPI002A23C9E7|nr:decorin-binding protein DbpA [Borreliella sinica]WPM06382.1 decorin-binding protein DbpA [Borreliella sinica]